MKNKFFKKALSVFTAMAMMLSLMTGIPFSELGLDITVSAASAAYDGDPVAPQKITSSNYRSFGFTESNWGQYNGYYAIRNAKELYGFAEIINDYNLPKTTKAVLLNDIVVNETVSESGATYSWTPIGGDVYFSGEFDGNGHSISGLYCNTPDESNVGLFGYAGEAIIRNVTLENSYLCGNTRVGGIVGRLSSATLTNCKVDSDVTIVATSSDEAVNVGGMFGKADIVSIQHAMCNFTNCTSLATVKALNVHKRESGYYEAQMGAFCGSASYEYCEQTAGTNCFYVPNSVTGADGTSDRGAGKDNVINERLATITIDNNGEITDTHTHVSATHSRIEPTCYSTGLTEYSYCIICGEITSGTKEEIPIVDHEYSDATCTVLATCAYCGHQEGELNSDNHETVETHYEVSESNRRMHDKVYNCCGAIILSESHTISNGSCTVCGWVCQHLSVTNGKCDDCGIEGDTSYVNRYWDAVNKKVITNDYALVGNVTEITSLTTTLSEGWYIVKGEITNDNRLTVSGEVNLILTDGCTLNVSSGINVPSGTTLNIYGQQQGTGTLTAGTTNKNYPAIGGEPGGCGTITINGGKVNANVSAEAAAIGSAYNSYNSDGGSVEINGGEISASQSLYGAPIGSGTGNNGCSVTINGGKVNATHSGSYGAAIGSGDGGSCSVVIRGGTVTANNLDNYNGAGDGIGKGRGSTCTVTIEGGNIRATKTYSSSAEVRDPKNASDTSVSLVEITLDGVADGTDVTELEGITYGIYDVKTIGDKLYLYLPADTMPTSVTAGDECYDCYKDGVFYQHSWVDATCYLPKYCSRCEITEGEASSHNYENGVCTYCGKDTNGAFHITTAEHLVAFAQSVNAGNKDANAELDADINMTGVAWTPICQTVSFHDTAATDTGYSGTFDGNGHTISNLTVTFNPDTSKTYSHGLFGTVSGTVKNLGMVNFEYENTAGDTRAGSIAGQVLTGGTITNCYSVGHTVTTNTNIAGGIAGCTYGGTISNCYALNGSVSGYSDRWGGVVGDCKKDNTAPDLAQTYGTVSNCYTDNTRVASSQNNSANITNCAVKDDDAFASGEITYLLNGSSSGNVTWYQTLETDTYPVLDSEHGTVYSVFNCDESATVYRNVNENEPHTDNNSDGVCDVCGGNAHIHEWTYTASNNTITAECGAADCPATGTNTIVISASGKTYDGTAVTATVENNVDGTDYSSSIIYKDNDGDVVTEAVNAGTYTANLTVGGVTASVEFTIAKGTPDIGTVSASNLVNTLDVSEVVLSRSNETVPGTLSLADGTTLQYGTKDYTYVFTPNDNTNYETVTGTVSITITDTNAPTATYKVGTDGWKQFINTITFGHFCKDYTTVDITYSDEGSGVADKQYYISNEEITNTENIQWSEYTDTLNINATGKYYIYVRVTDNYGNVVIQNSEGIVVYEESVIAPTSLTFEYGDENDLYINISANGNTFANLADGSGNEIATENYSIDGSTLTIKGEYLSDLDVGEYTYKICMNPQGVENTEVTLAYSFVVKVTAKELTVTADNASKTYGEDDPTFTYTATGLEVGDTLTGTLSRETGENVGTYAITQGTLTNENNPNYDITFVEGTFTINKATPPALTIPTATSITYGEKLSASTLSDSSWAWVDGTIVPDAYTDCNAYIEVDDSNYDYTSVYGYDSANHRVVRDITVIINRATLTITANSYTIKVGSALPTYDYTVTGLVGDDTLPVDVTISCSATDSNAVGAYPITISGVVSDAPLASHYVINYVNGTLTITEKDIQEIKADDVTLTYGETKNIGATTNGDGAITYSTTSDVISIAADGTITALKAGTATVTINAAETDNYAAATKTVTVTVNKKKVAVPTADTTEYTYTGTAQTYGVTSTDDYTVEGGVQTNAGEYPITITLNNENYEWDGTLGTYKFVINKAAVTVTAKSYSIKVGDTLPTYAYDVAGLVNGETLPIDVTISCNAADSNTAGTYTITVSGAANSTNYTFAYVNGTLTISNKLEQTITASDVTLTYGETGKKITATTSGDGAISYSTTSDVISVAADGTITALKAGTATVTINAAETDTYAAATKTVTVTVNKAAVTVTAKSYTIKVGEALPTYAYDVAGLVNGETLPIDVTISCNVADSNTAGTYDIIVSGAAASDNYTFSYVKGTLTVSEKEVVAAPTFTPPSGTTFTSSQKVTISCATAGAKIYYTTDGTEPTTASTLYNGAFTITTTTTIKAIAVKDGMTDSAVASITFTKNEYRPPVYPSYPIVTTTTTTTTTPAPVDDDEIIDEDIDDDSDDEDIEIDEDTDTTKPVDDGDEPQIKGEDDKTGWDVIADEIADADDGDKIVVDMNGTTEVPEDILEQIQGQDIDLVIELDNGFTWTINGESVTEPMDIDLGVNEGTTIPVKVINEVTGECSYITITLTHNGEFGFTAVLTVDMGDENEGLYANLYWYTSGNTEFICADKINNKGKAALTFTHASEYIIVIDETNHGKRVEESDDADEDADSDVDNIFNGEEDDDVNPFTAVTISFTGVIISAAAVVLTRKRKNK